MFDFHTLLLPSFPIVQKVLTATGPWSSYLAESLLTWTSLSKVSVLALLQLRLSLPTSPSGFSTVDSRTLFSNSCRLISGMAIFQWPARPLLVTRGSVGGKRIILSSHAPWNSPWNSEHVENGNLRLSHIIYPWKGYICQDQKY